MRWATGYWSRQSHTSDGNAAATPTLSIMPPDPTLPFSKVTPGVLLIRRGSFENTMNQIERIIETSQMARVVLVKKKKQSLQ